MAKVRTTAPSTSNKYYKHTSAGGLNECIHIGNGSCLPNCVGYCWGAFYEMLGKRPSLSRRNAKEWYGYSADGYSRGQTPKLGAVACWGGTQYGHVAIVVGIYSDRIRVAQSNYGGNRFEVVDCYKTATGYKSHAGNIHFQGFIYCPVSVTNTETSSSKSNSTTVKTYFNSACKNGKAFTTTANINQRLEPNTTSTVRQVIPKGNKVMYYGYYAIVNNIVWFWVSYNNKDGYIYGYKLGEKKAPYITGLTINGKNV